MEPDTIILFSVLISLLLIILFIFMVVDISAIKKQVLVISSQMKRGYADAFWEGEIKELQGKKQEALDLFIESLYWFNKHNQSENLHPDQLSHKQKIEDKIRSLGGKVD